MGRLGQLAALLCALALVAGCGGGGGDEPSADPVSRVPEENGLQDQVRAAQEPSEADFPSAEGKNIEELASEVRGAGATEVGMATSVFTPGENRLAFGVIDGEGQFVYGPTAVYIARGPDDKVFGPYPAPADVLLTEGRYRSRQAATESDPFAAVYAAEVPFKKTGNWAVLTITKDPEGDMLAAGTQVQVRSDKQDPIPDVGEEPPAVETDTEASAKGNIEAIDTRVPPSDLHETSFDEVLGKKPVALLFATPQLCQSRVCGPVVDVALQLRDEYGDQMEFIHQEVYVDNDPQQGLREPLNAFRLPTEPWLFVVDASGTVTARLEGSFGLSAFENAVKTAL